MYIPTVVHIARYRLKRVRKRKEGEIQQCSRKVDGGPREEVYERKGWAEREKKEEGPPHLLLSR